MKELNICNACRVIPFYWYSGLPEIPYDIEFARRHFSENKDEILSLFQLNDDETAKQMDLICTLREKDMDDLYTYDDYRNMGRKLDYFCDETLSPKGDVTFIDIGATLGGGAHLECWAVPKRHFDNQ